MEYPKYKREEKLSAKLSKKEVSYIRILRKNGYTFKTIATMYGISQPHAYYICMTSDKLKKRLEQKKKYRQENDNGDKTHAKRARNRKEQLMGEKLTQYRQERKEHTNILWNKRYHKNKAKG